MAAGGIRAGILAVRSGQAEKVAQIVLGGLSLNALFGSVITGFGINTAFTDLALRRYALSNAGRLAARHVTGILEPVWLFVLALFLGFSTSLYAMGAGSFWLGALAVLILLVTVYLLARVMATLIEWLSRVRGGTAILFVMIIAVSLLPGILIPQLAKSKGTVQAIVSVLSYTPPFAAAALMTHAAAGVLAPLGMMALWTAVLIVVLAAIEKQAAKPRSAAVAAVTWDDRYERVAAIFGPGLAPLVGRTLRYYVRSNKVRFNFIAALPLLTFLTFKRGEGDDPLHFVVRAIGTFAICGFLGTAVMSTNQFGFDSSGFRRYFLLPVAPGKVLRAASFTALFVGGILVIAGLALWIQFAPVPKDPRTDLMLAACGVGGVVLFQCALHLDLAAVAAGHQFRDHLRKSAFAQRQHSVDRRRDAGHLRSRATG